MATAGEKLTTIGEPEFLAFSMALTADFTLYLVVMPS